MPVCVASKSSTYDEPLFDPDFWAWGSSWAYSAVRLIFDGAVALTVGILLSRLVSHINSWFHARLNPSMELFTVSSPMFTFSVRAFSEKWSRVAPMLRFFENLYCMSRPSRVFRCMEKSDWFSSVTEMFCPESIIDWLVIVTIPIE